LKHDSFHCTRSEEQNKQVFEYVKVLIKGAIGRNVFQPVSRTMTESDHHKLLAIEQKLAELHVEQSRLQGQHDTLPARQLGCENRRAEATRNQEDSLMPWKPKTFRPAGHAEAIKRYDRQRGTAAQRGYDATWKKLRDWFLRQPENVVCACGCGRLSECVDHIEAIAGPADPKRLDIENLQAMTESCHRSKTARHNGGVGRPPDRSPAAVAEIQAMLAAAKARAAAINARLAGQ
jgi:5-methylcytosine-specific restriction endonuclease McrA